MSKKISKNAIAFIITLSFLYSTETNLNITTDGIGTTYISDRGFQNKKVIYSIKDNLAVFEGDIILGEIDETESWREINENNNNNDNNSTSNSIIITGNRYRWPNAILVYQVASNVSSSTRTLISQARNHWETETNIRFIERTASNANVYPNYVEVVSNKSACYSYIGMIGGKQELNVVSACGFGAVVHEFGHALGLWHEQSREDRNNFVRINTANIQAGQEHNFDQEISNGDDIGSYDYGSIMHYGRTAFGINGAETITPLTPNVTIGQRNGLSVGDIASINSMYSTSVTTPPTPSTPTASDGSYSDKVRLTWSSVSGATSYKMYRCTNTSTSSCSYLGSDTSSPYDDTNGDTGTSYYYRIKASNAAGDSAYSAYNSGYKSITPSITTLTSGIAISSNVANQAFQHFKINVLSGGTVTILLSGLSSDNDLYVRVGAEASKSFYDCKSTAGGNTNETCSITVNSSNDVYIGVYGYEGGNYTIQATIVYVDTDNDGIPNNIDTDDDNDGISDIDELRYGLNPLDARDALLDSDGDGVNNKDEIEAGSNPLDPHDTKKPKRYAPIMMDGIIIMIPFERGR